MRSYIIVTEPQTYTRWYYNPGIDVALGLLFLLLIFISIAYFLSYRSDDQASAKVYYVDADKTEKGESSAVGKDKKEKKKKTRYEEDITGDEKDPANPKIIRV